MAYAQIKEFNLTKGGESFRDHSVKSTWGAYTSRKVSEAKGFVHFTSLFFCTIALAAMTALLGSFFAPLLLLSLLCMFMSHRNYFRDKIECEKYSKKKVIILD